MDEMIRYIFGTLHDSERAMRITAKALKQQGVFNRNFAFISLTMATCIFVHSLEIRNMRSQIETLEKEIKELKQTEGD